MTPSISIVVPVYNVSTYLERCLSSLAAQTLTDIEIIMVNDESPDPQDKIICEQFASNDARFKYFAHERNLGLGGARNTGIEKASAPYIAFLDSDDWVAKYAYATMLERIKEYDADFVQCSAIRSYDNPQNNWPFIQYTHIQILDGEAILNSVPQPNAPAFFNTQTAAWNKLYKKSLFTDNQIRYRNHRLLEDIEVTYKVAFHAKRAVCMPEALVHYYDRDTSIMNVFSEKHVHDLLSAFDEVRSFLSHHHSFSKVTSGYARQLCEYVSFFTQGIHKEENSGALLRQIVSHVYQPDILETLDNDAVFTLLNPIAASKSYQFTKLSNKQQLIQIMKRLLLRFRKVMGNMH